MDGCGRVDAKALCTSEGRDNGNCENATQGVASRGAAIAGTDVQGMVGRFVGREIGSIGIEAEKRGEATGTAG